MEDGERIPTEIEQPADAAGETVLSNGTVVYDIYAPPCPDDGETSSDGTIVVCGQSERTAEFEAELVAQGEPQAVKLTLSENADATIIGSTTAMPMGGNSQQATVRLRAEF